jgi:hypothetical protein
MCRPPIDVHYLCNGTVLQHHPIAASEGAFYGKRNPGNDVSKSLSQPESEKSSETSSDHRQPRKIICGQKDQEAREEADPIQKGAREPRETIAVSMAFL